MVGCGGRGVGFGIVDGCIRIMVRFCGWEVLSYLDGWCFRVG